MTRTAIVFATALLFAAPVFAADQTGEPSQTRSVEQTEFVQAATTTKPTSGKGETSDYLVVTLTDASIAKYDF